jgi:cell wall-associated NlpC family hydrolase
MLSVFRSPGFDSRGRAWAATFALVAGLASAGFLGGCANAPVASSPTSASAAHAPVRDTITLFPMGAYSQDVDHWIDPAASDYDTPFLAPDAQRAHFEALEARYFGTGQDDPSPWNPAFIRASMSGENGADIAALQEGKLALFNNAGKTDRRVGYGMNFRPHTEAWIDAIARNVNAGQFGNLSGYDPSRRAIATTTLLVRDLPTFDPSFYDHRLAGEGYPFDNLQVSAIRPGTPIYMLGTSADGGWHYVLTPDVQGWVRSDGVAGVDDAFVSAWRAAFRKMPGVIVTASAAVRDSGGVFRFDAPAGTLLPLQPSAQAGGRVILIPARDADGHAVLRTGMLAADQIADAPLAATPRHLAGLIKALIGRPYGWGNTNFDNDCSAELQSIFAAFGVWLPRHSSTQMDAGDAVDLSDETPAARLDYLAKHGQPMRTLIYIGGHVMLYLGNVEFEGRSVPLVYQDVWGLRPADDSRRAVIGGSVFLPLLLIYPEDPSLQSLAATQTFQISIIGMPAAGEPATEKGINPAG